MLKKRLPVLLSLSLFTLGSIACAGPHDATMTDDISTLEAYEYSMDNRDDVRKVQRALNERGFHLDVDGIVGTKTGNALHEFQQQAGVKTAHSFNKETLQALGIIPMAETWGYERRPASVYEAVMITTEPEAVDTMPVRRYRRSAIYYGFGIPQSSLEHERPSIER